MFDSIIVVIVIIFMLVSLYRDIMQPALVFLIAVLVFYFTGIINIQEILKGLSNENIILIFLLLAISNILKKSAVLDATINRFLKPNLSHKRFVARTTGIVSLFSAWVNNTPLVAFMMPYVYEWAKKRGISPSKVMLPLSYAALMGGTITLIGTSTNLILNGLAVDAGLQSLYIFDFVYVGIPAAILGSIYLIFIGTKLLPDRKTILGNYSEQSREYLVETIVPPMSKLIGKSIEKANLRNLEGLYLAQIIRDDEIIAPVSLKEIIHRKDRLFFAGDTEKILNLVEGTKNLILPFGRKMLVQNENNIVEVILTNNSKLHNHTAKSSNFRKKYDSAIIAIQRNGEKLRGKIGEIVLKAGDLLLLVAGKNFNNYTEKEQDFFVTSRIKQIDRIPSWKIWVLFSALVLAFGFSIARLLPLFIGLIIVIGVAAFIKIVRFPELKNTVDLNLFFILILALAVGKAIYNSGAAMIFAETLISIFHSNTITILIVLYIITNITSMFVTNAAAVAITFPVAMAVASELGVTNFTPFILTIAYAGSAEFITPFGYQTNLMVYGPGGYKFKDYVKVGFPLTLLYLILTITILGSMFKLF